MVIDIVLTQRTKIYLLFLTVVFTMLQSIFRGNIYASTIPVGIQNLQFTKFKAVAKQKLCTKDYYTASACSVDINLWQ